MYNVLKTNLLSRLRCWICLAVCLPALHVAQTQELSIVPKPNSLRYGQGSVVINNNTQLVFGDPSVLPEAEEFVSGLSQLFSIRPIAVPEMQPGSHTSIVLSEANWPQEAPERYELQIEKDKITVRAQKGGSGFFYALNTLLQIAGSVRPSEGPQAEEVVLPCLKIEDEPRYKWRGMHLDVVRHFFDVAFIKKYIDVMAFYKLNTFHWHLTDDQGWRIEIKKYPNLLVKAAWRNGTMIGRPSEKKYDNLRHGGFYTQEEIKQIVQYAAKKHITIVPEIEMPGHSVAAIAAYPWLSCTGKPLEVERGWGVFDDVYCTKDSTIKFLEDVLAEVIELFPGQYIHIGGDECPKTRWKKCPKCQARMKKEGLKNEEELQSYFVRRIEKFINSKGRQIIGWDEILEGGLAPNASVMSWRGTAGGVAAARQKHYVVMSPGKPCYFDHYQAADKDNEPLAIGGYNPVDSIYNYNPSPAGLSVTEQKFILGAQANLWTEYIPNDHHAQYMLLPRMLALSEAVWTFSENKQLPDFKKRLVTNLKWLDYMKVNYARHSLNSR